MPPRPKPRPAASLEAVADTGPGMAVDLDRNDPGAEPPDSMPPRNRGRTREPTEDGGNPQHPIHDEDQEDKTPADYEREIERLGACGSRSID